MRQIAIYEEHNCYYVKVSADDNFRTYPEPTLEAAQARANRLAALLGCQIVTPAAEMQHQAAASPASKKQKFYAVRKGYSTGIFTTWEECQKQVNGYPGAVFKSFKTRPEAEAYLNSPNRQPAPSPTPETRHHIFDMRRESLEYTKDQEKALIAAAAFMKDRRVTRFVLAGYAGTGKTTIVENIVNYAQHLHRKVYIAAPTNQAVKVLREKLSCRINDVDFRTLHSLLYGHPTEDGQWIPKVNFERDNLVISDEASMINQDVYDHLADRITTAGAKMLFLGDSFQLEPIGQDPRLLNNSDLELAEVKRQAANSKILLLATAIRNHRKILVPNTSDTDVFLLPPVPAEKRFLEAVKAGKNAVFIVGSNSSRLRLNALARMAKFGKDAADEPRPGDILLAISNGWRTINGDRLALVNPRLIQTDAVTLKDYKDGQPVQITAKAHILEDEGHKIILFPAIEKPSVYHGQLVNLDCLPPDWWGRNPNSNRFELDKEVSICCYCYAVTAHKCQGSQWDTAFVNQDCFRDNPRWLYTAITRAAKELILVDTGAAKTSWQQITDIALSSPEQ